MKTKTIGPMVKISTPDGPWLSYGDRHMLCLKWLKTLFCMPMEKRLHYWLELSDKQFPDGQGAEVFVCLTINGVYRWGIKAGKLRRPLTGPMRNWLHRNITIGKGNERMFYLRLSYMESKEVTR